MLICDWLIIIQLLNQDKIDINIMQETVKKGHLKINIFKVAYKHFGSNDEASNIVTESLQLVILALF